MEVFDSQKKAFDEEKNIFSPLQAMFFIEQWRRVANPKVLREKKSEILDLSLHNLDT